MIDFFKYDDLIIAYNKLSNQNFNLLRQISNQKDVIAAQKDKIKSLSHQINLLNRSIWRYKNGKN